MSKTAISIAVTSLCQFSSHPRPSLSAAMLLHLLHGFLVLQELTPSCIQQSVPCMGYSAGGGWEVLHCPSPRGAVVKHCQKPRDWFAQEDWPQQPTPNSASLLPCHSFPSSSREYPSFGIGLIRAVLPLAVLPKAFP